MRCDARVRLVPGAVHGEHDGLHHRGPRDVAARYGRDARSGREQAQAGPRDRRAGRRARSRGCHAAADCHDRGDEERDPNRHGPRGLDEHGPPPSRDRDRGRSAALARDLRRDRRDGPAYRRDAPRRTVLDGAALSGRRHSGDPRPAPAVPRRPSDGLGQIRPRDRDAGSNPGRRGDPPPGRSGPRSRGPPDAPGQPRAGRGRGQGRRGPGGDVEPRGAGPGLRRRAGRDGRDPLRPGPGGRRGRDPVRGAAGRAGHARDALADLGPDGARVHPGRARDRRAVLGRYTRALHRPRRARGRCGRSDRTRRGRRHDPGRPPRAAARPARGRRGDRTRRGVWAPLEKELTGLLARYARTVEQADLGAVQR